MGILSKHIGEPQAVDIGEDKIYLKPLTTEDMPLFFKAMKAFSGAKEGATSEDILKNMDDANLTAVAQLIDKTLTKSLPDEPVEDRKTFGMKYMQVLLPKIIEINMAGDKSHESTKKEELLARLGK
jgi:hypothetical protein